MLSKRSITTLTAAALTLAAATASTAAAREYTYTDPSHGAKFSYDTSTGVTTVCDIKTDGAKAQLIVGTERSSLLFQQFDVLNDGRCSLRAAPTWQIQPGDWNVFSICSDAPSWKSCSGWIKLRHDW